LKSPPSIDKEREREFRKKRVLRVEIEKHEKKN